MIGMLGALAAIQGEPRLDDTSVVPPLDRMAALPQAFIMQQAQKGQIPKEMVAPILAKKAENAQAAAMQNAAFKQAAMQGGPVPPSTVIEGIIAKNAQAEVGIPTVAGNNVANPAFMRSGGIVAFDNGGMPFVGPPSRSELDALSKFGAFPSELSEEDELKKQIQMRLDARKEFLGDAPKMDTSPEITGRDLALAGLQAAFSMGQGPNFLSNVLEGGKAGVASLTKTPQDRAAAEFKAKQTEYLAKSGAVDEALKTVGRRTEAATAAKDVRELELEKIDRTGTVKERLQNLVNSKELERLGMKGQIDIALQTMKGKNALEQQKIANEKMPDIVKILEASNIPITAENIEILSKAQGKFVAREAALITQNTKVFEAAMDQLQVDSKLRPIIKSGLKVQGGLGTEKELNTVIEQIKQYNKMKGYKEGQPEYIPPKKESARRFMEEVIYPQYPTLADNLRSRIRGVDKQGGGGDLEFKRNFNDLKKEPEK